MRNAFFANKRTKYIPSKYLGVQSVGKEGEDFWTTNIKGLKRIKYKTEREAAIAVDVYKIQTGKQPVNVLKKKTN